MNWRTAKAVDQNGVEFNYGELWAYGIDDTSPLSDGTERINTAKALEIAMDVMTGPRNFRWTDGDINQAVAVLAGVRAQSGVEGPDADFLVGPGQSITATQQIDIWVYG